MKRNVTRAVQCAVPSCFFLTIFGFFFTTGLHYVGSLEVEDPLAGCSVGHSDSETRYLRSYLDPTYESGRMFLCDTPGFQDTVSPNVDIANAVAISWAIRRSNSVRLVLIIEANIILSTRGHELKNLFSLIQRFLDNVEDHLESVFVYL